ncbi:DUF2059 domain-containing protein [Mucilaginibacter kameinonensis]|uniref:DUF2059 domain-containing protein n=1 Tax=Mucilaginibacter kameinonensis TaxID=452286 RepID=UPI0013CEF3BC|nr:DUF2059 domain-containing protein [Mucilaginibacter kameinonensis]
MNLKLKLIAFAGVILFFSSSLKAQTTEQTLTPTHLAAAQQMLLALGIDKQFGTIVTNQIDALANQAPEDKRAGFKKVMKTFMDKYFTWDLLKDKMMAIYANEFTEDELKQITTFYNSPVGQKVGQKLPSLMQKGMMVGQEAVEAHKEELQQMIQEEFAQKTDPPVVKEQVLPATKKPASKSLSKH